MTGEDNGSVDQQRALYCYKAGLRALDGVMEIAQVKPTDMLTIIQAHLLLEMYAIMALCGSYTTQGLRLHSQCVEVSLSCPEHSVPPNIHLALSKSWSDGIIPYPTVRHPRS